MISLGPRIHGEVRAGNWRGPGCLVYPCSPPAPTSLSTSLVLFSYSAHVFFRAALFAASFFIFLPTQHSVSLGASCPSRVFALLVSAHTVHEMISLTVGYISGIIAASIFFLQFLIPNALIVVLVASLRCEHSTVTWSVVQRNLLSSMWPVFLRSDATASRGVDRSISLLTWLRPLALGLVTIAAVVTPLGLYEEILPSKEPELVSFSYVQDPGPMGFGTPPRSDLGFTRVCGGFLPAQCPGTTVEIVTSGNDTFLSANITSDDYDTRIPRVLAELYQSGLAQQTETVSSFFDIESRQYSYQFQEGMLNDEKYIVTFFRQLQNVILNDAIEPFEGIIANTKTGGVAFRNHTAPRESRYGAEWTENLLWIEPETACVDTNISIEYRLPYGSLYSTDLTNASLVDNGGFANLVTEYPLVDVHDSQAHPNLQGRAYKAAWMVNAYTMLIMNVGCRARAASTCSIVVYQFLIQSNHRSPDQVPMPSHTSIPKSGTSTESFRARSGACSWMGYILVIYLTR